MERPSCDGRNTLGQMASPPSDPTTAHKGIRMHRRMPEAQPEHLVLIVIACSSTSLILSLRAVRASYICAAFTCDLGPEIELYFKKDILLNLCKKKKKQKKKGIFCLAFNCLHWHFVLCHDRATSVNYCKSVL